MNSARERACEKQRKRGNAPENTRRTEEERRDHWGYRTGLIYREWSKLPRKERFEEGYA